MLDPVLDQGALQLRMSAILVVGLLLFLAAVVALEFRGGPIEGFALAASIALLGIANLLVPTTRRSQRAIRLMGFFYLAASLSTFISEFSRS
jgi:hypothetical protein